MILSKYQVKIWHFFNSLIAFNNLYLCNCLWIATRWSDTCWEQEGDLNSSLRWRSEKDENSEYIRWNVTLTNTFTSLERLIYLKNAFKFMSCWGFSRWGPISLHLLLKPPGCWDVLGCTGAWCLVPALFTGCSSLTPDMWHIIWTSGSCDSISNLKSNAGGCVCWSLLMLPLIDDGLATGVCNMVRWSGVLDLDTGHPPHYSHHAVFLQKHRTPVTKLSDVVFTCIHMATSHLCLLIK